MRFDGKIHRFGDHIDTDLIISGSQLTRTDDAHLARHCFATLHPNFAETVAPGDVAVAGENFGCGSSREHAPLAIKATGIGCVVASSFARIFYRSAINIGLPAIVCPEAVALAESGAPSGRPWRSRPVRRGASASPVSARLAGWP